MYLQDITEYKQVFKLIDEYENGTLARVHWAEEMLQAYMTNFWTKKMKEVCNSIVY